MPVSTVDDKIESTRNALLEYSNRFADVLRQTSNPSRHAVGVWSIAETAVHVSQSSTYFVAAARGDVACEDLEDNAAATVRSVEAEAERRLSVLADRIVAGERTLVDYSRTVRGDPVVGVFQGLTLPLSSLLAIELGELLVHGFDVAVAAGLPWQVEPSVAAIAVAGELRVMPLLLRRGRRRLRLRCEVDIRQGECLRIVVEGGRLRIEPPDASRVDCRLSVDPLTFLLVIFHRVSPAPAMLTGKITLFGRRPWSVLRLMRALKTT